MLRPVIEFGLALHDAVAFFVVILRRLALIELQNVPLTGQHLSGVVGYMEQGGGSRGGDGFQQVEDETPLLLVQSVAGLIQNQQRRTFDGGPQILLQGIALEQLAVVVLAPPEGHDSDSHVNLGKIDKYLYIE